MMQAAALIKVTKEVDSSVLHVFVPNCPPTLLPRMALQFSEQQMDENLKD